MLARAAEEMRAQISSGVLNWEAEKQRILAALEADFEEENEEDREEKLKIQDVIRKTDRVVAEKDREIGELRELLESQTNNIGSMAVGAAALGKFSTPTPLFRKSEIILPAYRKNVAINFARRKSISRWNAPRSPGNDRN